MGRKFKPFDKVIIKSGIDKYWSCDFYSHLDKVLGAHETINSAGLTDNEILPYEGNEHLVGTRDEPEEEVRLEEGELVVYFENIKYLENMDLLLARFDGVINDLIKVKSDCMKKWEYAIRFSDFNPNDMEETSRHILCVKNGKIVKYKG